MIVATERAVGGRKGHVLNHSLMVFDLEQDIEKGTIGRAVYFSK